MEDEGDGEGKGGGRREGNAEGINTQKVNIIPHLTVLILDLMVVRLSSMQMR